MKTKCFTYEVVMTIQILSDSEEDAKITLDDKGGYISNRKVKLIKTTDLSDTIKLVK
jgi:hypothetical protein